MAAPSLLIYSMMGKLTRLAQHRTADRCVLAAL